MRVQLSIPLSRRAIQRQRGFTLPEMLIAITVFTMLIGGVIFAHLYGLSMYRITETKLNVTDDARRMVGKLVDEIRTCESAVVGNVTNGAFVGLLDGEKQEGNGLMIFHTTNSASFVVYFLNTGDSTFRRTTGSPGTAVILADGVTNKLAFKSQDFKGKTLTNTMNTRVIHLGLDFYHQKRHLQVADYYRLETSVTRRALE